MAELLLELHVRSRRASDCCDVRRIPYAMLLLLDALSQRTPCSRIPPCDGTSDENGGNGVVDLRSPSPRDTMPSGWFMLPLSPNDRGCVLLTPLSSDARPPSQSVPQHGDEVQSKLATTTQKNDAMLRFVGCCATHYIKGVDYHNAAGDRVQDRTIVVHVALSLTPCGYYLMPLRWPSPAVQRLRAMEATFFDSAVPPLSTAMPLLLVSLADGMGDDDTEAAWNSAGQQRPLDQFIGRNCSVVLMPFLSAGGGVVPLMPLLVADGWPQVLTTHVVSAAAASDADRVAMQHHLDALGDALMGGLESLMGGGSRKSRPGAELLWNFYEPRLLLSAVRMWFIVRYPHGVPTCFQPPTPPAPGEDVGAAATDRQQPHLPFVLPDTLLVNNIVPLGLSTATTHKHNNNKGQHYGTAKAGDGVLCTAPLPAAMHAAAAATISSIVQGLCQELDPCGGGGNAMEHDGPRCATTFGDGAQASLTAPRLLDGSPEGVELHVQTVARTRPMPAVDGGGWSSSWTKAPEGLPLHGPSPSTTSATAATAALRRPVLSQRDEGSSIGNSRSAALFRLHDSSTAGAPRHHATQQATTVCVPSPFAAVSQERAKGPNIACTSVPVPLLATATARDRGEEAPPSACGPMDVPPARDCSDCSTTHHGLAIKAQQQRATNASRTSGKKKGIGASAASAQPPFTQDVSPSNPAAEPVPLSTERVTLPTDKSNDDTPTAGAAPQDDVVGPCDAVEPPPVAMRKRPRTKKLSPPADAVTITEFGDADGPHEALPPPPKAPRKPRTSKAFPHIDGAIDVATDQDMSATATTTTGARRRQPRRAAHEVPPPQESQALFASTTVAAAAVRAMRKLDATVPLLGPPLD